MDITSPSTIIFARSPVLYSMFDSNYDEVGFNYNLDVYLWAGAIGDKPATANYSLAKPPALNGTAIFNISSILTELFINYDFDFVTSLGPDDTGTVWYWVGIDYGYTYGATTSSTALTSLPCVNGFNYYQDGISYVPTNRLGASSASYFLSDRPLDCNVPLNTSMFLFLMNNSYLTSVKIKINSGAVTTTYTLSAYSSMVLAIPSGTKEVDPMIAPALTTYSIYGVNSGGTTVTQVYNYTVIDTCLYGFRNLMFLNRYGVWDNIIIYGSQFEKIDVDRGEVFNSPLYNDSTSAMTFKQRQGQYNNVNIHSREILTVNTGWIAESWNEVIKQMLVSPYLFDADTLEPFIVQNSNFNYKTGLNEGLINYTFELKYAFTAINTVY